MPTRLCLDCSRVTTGSRCDECRRANERQRPRDLGKEARADHQRHRRAWAERVATGTVPCSRCGHPIVGQAWDMDRRKVGGLVRYFPSHASCNRSAGAAP